MFGNNLAAHMGEIVKRVPAVSGSRGKDNEQLVVFHVVRSIVGGIFRHISDLVRHQAASGHKVGLICDSLTLGPFEAERLEELRPFLKAGVQLYPMKRAPGLSDIKIIPTLAAYLSARNVDVIHCHGAKGGAYGRLAARYLNMNSSQRDRVVCVYTPHGGSLHYSKYSAAGAVYHFLERFLQRFTDELVFVSGYEIEMFRQKVGMPYKPWSIAYNGLRPEEFQPAELAENARAFGCLGHMRDLKGTDVFIDAIETANARSKDPVMGYLIGDGPDRARYEAEVKRRGLDRFIAFHDFMPIRDAFALCEAIVVPSRAEALPYVVLETIACGRPLIATKVGGIPEVMGPFSGDLLRPGDANLLATNMLEHLDNPEKAMERAEALKEHVEKYFSIHRMCETVDTVYKSHLPNAPRIARRPTKILDMQDAHPSLSPYLTTTE